jgi:hypothetical protein
VQEELFQPVHIVILLILLVVIPLWKICTKAGYPGILSLVTLIPVLNFIMLYFLAFSDWPVLKELNALRQKQAG